VSVGVAAPDAVKPIYVNQQHGQSLDYVMHFAQPPANSTCNQSTRTATRSYGVSCSTCSTECLPSMCLFSDPRSNLSLSSLPPLVRVLCRCLGAVVRAAWRTQGRCTACGHWGWWGGSRACLGHQGVLCMPCWLRWASACR
jgi:hypothetical protein